MKAIKFYINQVGKRCGYLDCSHKGIFLLPTREGMSGFRVTFWVSCGRNHAKVGA